MNLLFKSIPVLLLATTLTACGGGGTGASADAIPSGTATFPVETVYAKLASEPSTFTGQARDGLVTWSMSVKRTPMGDTTVKGERVHRFSETISIKALGLPVRTLASTEFFGTAPYWPRGLEYDSGAYGVQTVEAHPLPASATHGANGPLGAITVYESSDMAKVQGIETASWSLEEENPTTAFLCSNVLMKDTVKNEEAAMAKCYKIDNAGTVLGIRWKVSYGSKVLTFQ